MVIPTRISALWKCILKTFILYVTFSNVGWQWSQNSLIKMKSVEYNFQLKQCGLYKVPPLQVRWGNIKLFENGYIVCTQKALRIHVSCQASFGIFSKGGKLSLLQRKPQRRPQHHINWTLCSSQNVKRPHKMPEVLPLCLVGLQVPGRQKPGIYHHWFFFVRLRWLWTTSLSGGFHATEIHWEPAKCCSRHHEQYTGELRFNLDLNVLTI